MKKNKTQRRGVMLLLAVVLLAVVTGMLSLLALNTTRMHQQRQADRVRAAVQAMSDSAVAYARMELASAPTTRPSEPVELDVAALLPSQMTGSAVLTFTTSGDRPVCRVTARAALGNQAFERVTDVDSRESPEGASHDSPGQRPAEKQSPSTKP